MRKLILLALITRAAMAQEKPRDMAVSFSFPHLFTLERTFDLDERSYFEAFVGGLPISSLLFLDTHLSEAGYSDTHKIAYSLEAYTFSSGLRYGRKLSQSWSLIAELGLLYVHAGAQLHLKNIETGARMPFMGIGASIAQPVFGLAARKSWRSWALAVSVNAFLGTSISFKKSGWLPSFQQVAPEYKDAIDDGSEAAEKALGAAIDNVKAKFNFLPGFAVSYRF